MLPFGCVDNEPNYLCLFLYGGVLTSSHVTVSMRRNLLIAYRRDTERIREMMGLSQAQQQFVSNLASEETE